MYLQVDTGYRKNLLPSSIVDFTVHVLYNRQPVFLVYVLPHLLVQRRDGLDGGVQGIDVHSLFGVGVEVQQSSHQVLDEAQGLTRQVPGFQLKPQKEHTEVSGSVEIQLDEQICNLWYVLYF